MFAYYVRLALISIRKNIVMSALMVCAVALGIGACMTFVTLNYIMSQDPIPSRSGALHHVQLDTWDPNQPFREDGSPPNQLTYIDAMALMNAKPAFRQAAMVRTALVIEPDGIEARPFDADGRATFADFFAMFEVPFRYGGAWDEAADANNEQVTVLSRELNDRLFGGEDSVGKNIRVRGYSFQVVGVLDHWKPIPKFYDMNNDAVAAPADIFIPFNLVVALELPRQGNTSCWKPTGSDGMAAFLASECIWIQFWVELRDQAEERDYLNFLNNYASDQQALGRLPRPLNNRLLNVNEWLDDQSQGEEPLAMMLAVGVMFLVVCLLNTIGLLLAKFLGKAPEAGLRRALGASRRTLFAQYLVESGCIGVAAGALGVALTWLCLGGIDSVFGDAVANITHLDAPMIAATVGLAVLASVMAGLYPTWRACKVEPAAQLKSQ